VNWPETHYVYIEKTGPFQETAPEAWKNLHASVPSILENNKITGYMSLYKIKPKMIYRAGVVTASAPKKLPKGVEYMNFRGGKYSRFVLTGPYTELPMACGRIFEIVSEKKIKRGDDFNIENYVNDPRITPENQLITEILIPTL